MIYILDLVCMRLCATDCDLCVCRFSTNTQTVTVLKFFVKIIEFVTVPIHLTLLKFLLLFLIRTNV